MFEQWLTANGYDAAQLTDSQRKHLTAAWKDETQPKPPENPPEKPKASTIPFDEKMAVIEAEAGRVKQLHDMTEHAASAHVGNPEKIQQLRDLCQTATADKSMDPTKFSLALMRLDRMLPPMVMSPQSSKNISEDVIEAAICKAQRLPNIDDHYSEQVLEAAHKRFRYGVGLKELLVMAAERNSGYRGSSRDLHAVFKAAFPRGGHDEMMATGWGPSTISVSTMLSNVANKFLFVGFNGVENEWRKMSKIRSVNDYKQSTTVGLTGALTYAELPPSGEIKHGTLGETSYTNQATVYARMLGFDERDIRNDDLGGLASAAQRLGRGGALTLNEAFYTKFMNNSAFFTAGNNNVITGATSVLSGSTGLEALRLADEKFRLQTDPDGKPLGAVPRILLVPASLRVSALNLMNSTTVVGTTTANSMMPDQNAFAGAFEVVSSPYLQNSSFTGYSTTAWYLLADPNDLPAVEVVFLDGIDTPTIESSEADFNMLGVQMRGTLRFGVALQEFRAGVRAAGA